MCVVRGGSSDNARKGLGVGGVNKRSGGGERQTASEYKAHSTAPPTGAVALLISDVTAG